MHQVRDKRPRFRLRLVRKLVLRKILRHGNQFPSDVIPRLQHAFRLAGSRPRGLLRGSLRPQGSQCKTHSQPYQRKSRKTSHLFSPLSVEAKGFLSPFRCIASPDVSLKWEKGRPTGSWPNAPSDQCLPVSILVQRNALVLSIQFHLPDKSCGFRGSAQHLRAVYSLESEILKVFLDADLIVVCLDINRPSHGRTQEPPGGRVVGLQLGAAMPTTVHSTNRTLLH